MEKIGNSGNGRQRTGQRRVALSLILWSSCWLFTCNYLVDAQFKETGPPPYPPAVARKKIKDLLEAPDRRGPKEIIAGLIQLVTWYRDVLDEELVSAWKGNRTTSLPEIVKALSDKRVAAEIVDYSWRQRSESTFNVAYAPILVDLMTRYPESATPFLGDLLASPAEVQALTLTQSQVVVICTILLDLPDLGRFRESSLRILPRYRQVAEGLLIRDSHGADEEKSYRAQRWLIDLKAGDPVSKSRQQRPPTNLPRDEAIPAPSPIKTIPAPAVLRTEAQPARPALPSTNANEPSVLAYVGPKSGTFESSGGPIAGNSEYIFRNIPPGDLQLDYDTKIWDARIVPLEGQMRRLLVRNKSASPQKRCIVRWKVTP